MKYKTYLVYIENLPEPIVVNAYNWHIDSSDDLSFSDEAGNIVAYFLGRRLIGFHRAHV